MIAKLKLVFLTLVGLTYLGLAIWCSWDPITTSQKVGFSLQMGTGESEFLVVYGGLELGLSLIFLLPLIWKQMVDYAIVSCLVIHACLVVFRTISLFLYDGVGAMTYQLAIGEWVILILCLILAGIDSQAKPKLKQNSNGMA